MNRVSFLRRGRLCAGALLLTLGTACGALRSTTPQPSFYSLDSAWDTAPAPAPGATSTLIVNPTQAASGHDSQRIIYVREAHKLEYFAHSEWIDTPARMLAPLIVAAVENSGTFRAVVPAPSAGTGDLRLDTEVIRLQHEFSSQPSRVRFTLRAYLVDNKTRRVLAWREFDAAVPATSDDPYAGVVAANRAARIVLEDLAAFCADVARSKVTGE